MVPWAQKTSTVPVMRYQIYSGIKTMAISCVMTFTSAPVSSNARYIPLSAIYTLAFGVDRMYALRKFLSRTPIEPTLQFAGSGRAGSSPASLVTLFTTRRTTGKVAMTFPSGTEGSMGELAKSLAARSDLMSTTALEEIQVRRQYDD